MDSRRVIIDTDTASDDAQAILLSVLSDRVQVLGLTVVAGNVPLDRAVENAKYTLSLAGAAEEGAERAASTDDGAASAAGNAASAGDGPSTAGAASAGDRPAVPVYEGADRPLLKDWDLAAEVHGEGGLGGDLLPETDVPSASGYAPDFVDEAARERPGEVSLLCIGPLTNVALALQREPDLPDLLDEVWVMGGAANVAGNVTPAAEYNFWADPDAAKKVVRELDVRLVDWGLCLEASFVDGDTFDRIAAADAPYADFFVRTLSHVREFTREAVGRDGATVPDALAAALLLAPELRGEVGRYYADVDEREGMTRGYSLVDTAGRSGEEPRLELVESADADGFRELLVALCEAGDPDRAL